MIERIKKLLNIKNSTKPGIFDRIDTMYSKLGGDVISIKIGEDLIKFGDEICKIIDRVRTELSDETGFILPPVQVSDSNFLQENEYVIKIYETDIYSGFVVPNILGLDEIHDKLKETVYNNIKDLLTNENVEKYIDIVQKNNGWLIYSLCTRISPREIKIILGDLLSKGCSVKNINYIFEKIGDKVLIEHNWYNINPHKISDEIFNEL